MEKKMKKVKLFGPDTSPIVAVRQYRLANSPISDVHIDDNDELILTMLASNPLEDVRNCTMESRKDPNKLYRVYVDINGGFHSEEDIFIIPDLTNVSEPDIEDTDAYFVIANDKGYQFVFAKNDIIKLLNLNNRKDIYDIVRDVAIRLYIQLKSDVKDPSKYLTYRDDQTGEECLIIFHGNFDGFDELVADLKAFYNFNFEG
jgi:hypothetical protein